MNEEGVIEPSMTQKTHVGHCVNFHVAGVSHLMNCAVRQVQGKYTLCKPTPACFFYDRDGYT